MNFFSGVAVGIPARVRSWISIFLGKCFMFFFVCTGNCMAQKVPKVVNLVPAAISVTPNYWCTWKTQSFTIDGLYGNKKSPRWAKLDNLSQAHVFGKSGWASKMFPGIHKNLYLLFDDGWEVPLDSSRTGNDRRLMGSMVLALDKFPACKGSPAQRLKILNQMCRNAGWKGAALWIPAQASGEDNSATSPDSLALSNYFRERFNWCRIAGIRYLKVDWGYHMRDPGFRSRLSSLAKAVYPELIIEHAAGTPPLNDYGCPWCSNEFRQTGRFASCEMGKTFEAANTIIPVSEVFRTYDTSDPFNVTTTLDRLAEIFNYYSGNSSVSTILNCEDAPYIGAALGCSLGLMSTPAPENGRDVTVDFDAAVRAINWFKIAPAFSIGTGHNFASTAVLNDFHVFKEGESWIDWMNGKEVSQAAPAVISRNMPLPIVSSPADTPFVIAAKNPNGAISVATQPRNTVGRGLYFPLATVSIEAGNGKAPIGIFGRYQALQLNFLIPISGMRVFAQDLAGDTATDITKSVNVTGNSITLPGRLIEQIGLASSSPNDISEPGLVLVLRPAK